MRRAGTDLEGREVLHSSFPVGRFPPHSDDRILNRETPSSRSWSGKTVSCCTYTDRFFSSGPCVSLSFAVYCIGRSSTDASGVTGKAAESRESLDPLEVVVSLEKAVLPDASVDTVDTDVSELTELTDRRWISLGVANCNVVAFRLGRDGRGSCRDRLDPSRTAFRRCKVD